MVSWSKICWSESAIAAFSLQLSGIIYTVAHEAGIKQLSASWHVADHVTISINLLKADTYMIFPIKSSREKRWNYGIILFIDLLNLFIWPTNSYSNSSELWNFHVTARQKDFQHFLFSFPRSSITYTADQSIDTCEHALATGGKRFNSSSHKIKLEHRSSK